MIYDKSVRRVCALCEHALRVDEDTVLCHWKGPISASNTCRRFKYDPLLREPAKPSVLKSYNEDDFKL